MAHDRAVADATTDRRPALEAAARWCGCLAAVAGLFAAGFLVQWGNRYYISQVFVSPGPSVTVDEGQYAYDLLASAHDALLSAVVAMLLVGVLLVARAWLRSSDGPQAWSDLTVSVDVSRRRAGPIQ